MTEDAVQDSSNRPGIQKESLEILKKWYHVPVLALVFGFMVWTRVQSWKNFIQNGQVLYSGNDAWYHYRQVVYTVRHWPETMPFDVWTFFPYGTSVGQFGTLYDQIVATAALLVGAGSPSTHQVALTLLFAPAVFGALTVIPTYLVGKRLGGRLGGLLAAIVIALLPGLFLQRSLVGAADHNGAEPFFQAFAVVAMMVAVTVADRNRPVWEQVLDRDWAGLRSVIGWSVLSGFATALYLWMWPPGILLVGIFGVFFLVKLTGDYLQGTSPDHLAFPAVISLGVTGLMMLLPFGSTGFSATEFSLLQPLFSFAVASGAMFIAGLARVWDDRNLETTQFPLAIGGILAVVLGVVALVLPGLMGMIQSNLLRFVGFSAGAATRTIGEAQPWMSRTGRLGLGPFWVIFMDYGMAFFTALTGALWLLVKPHIRSRNLNRVGLVAAFLGITVLLFVAPGLPAAIGGIIGLGGQLVSLFIVVAFLVAISLTGDYESEQLLALVWAAFMTSAAFTQIRFNYYLAVSVAVFNAYLFAEVIGYFDFPSFASVREGIASKDIGDLWGRFDTSQVLVVVLLLLVIIAPLATAQTVTNQRNQRVTIPTAQQVGNSTSPGGFTNWEGSLEWMNNNTPAEGDWANANNEFAYYGTYEQTQDYDYPRGAYGVMSWWDYGHWITVEAERIPNANPFQEGASTAANYLLSPSEQRAEEILNNLDEDDAKTRYVMVDWQMIKVGSKFGAPVVFYDDAKVSQSDFYKPAIIVQQTGQGYRFSGWFSRQYVKQQRYYNSTMVRLYRYHGSAKKPQPVVVDWTQEGRTSLGPTLLMDNRTKNIKQFDNMSAAREYVRQDGSSQVGGISNLPSEYVPALQHYRLVAISDENLAPANYIFNGELRNVPAYLKTFERVPGATVEGTGPPNTVVEASVQMRIESYNTTFTYTQRAKTGPDGEFQMVLPYSTTGYENWGPENGHTNVSVRAAGPYTFQTPQMTEGEGNLTTVVYGTTANVTEAQVIGEDDSTVTVDLERQVLDKPSGANETSNNTSASTSAMSVELAGDGTSDAGDGSTDGTSTSSSLGGTSFATLGPSLGALGAAVLTTRRLTA